MLLTVLQNNDIEVRDLDAGPDACLRWPPTFSHGPDGTTCVTTPHIQDCAFFKPDAPAALPAELWKLCQRTALTTQRKR